MQLMATPQEEHEMESTTSALFTDGTRVLVRGGDTEMEAALAQMGEDRKPLMINTWEVLTMADTNTALGTSTTTGEQRRVPGTGEADLLVAVQKLAAKHEGLTRHKALKLLRAQGLKCNERRFAPIFVKATTPAEQVEVKAEAKPKAPAKKVTRKPVAAKTTRKRAASK
jgi:hypothetical protein